MIKFVCWNLYLNALQLKNSLATTFWLQLWVAMMWVGRKHTAYAFLFESSWSFKLHWSIWSIRLEFESIAASFAFARETTKLQSIFNNWRMIESAQSWKNISDWNLWWRFLFKNYVNLLISQLRSIELHRSIGLALPIRPLKMTKESNSTDQKTQIVNFLKLKHSKWMFSTKNLCKFILLASFH